METIETSDRNDWFDVGLQTYMSGELKSSTQTLKFTSDWNGSDLTKGGVIAIVNDMCPYFKLDSRMWMIITFIIQCFCISVRKFNFEQSNPL